MKKHIYILGVNISDHDRSVCLLKDGHIVCAIANERLDRRKYSIGSLVDSAPQEIEMPLKAITYCLRRENIKLDDLELLVVGRSIYSPLSQARQDIPILDYNKVIEMPFPGHHLSHALSAYYCSPFKESAVLVVDQMGSCVQDLPRIYEKHSIYHCKGTKINEVRKYFGTDDDISLGLFYDYFTNGFDFIESRVLLGNAGKLMGLSAYGIKNSSYPELIKVKQGNTIILKENIYSFFKGLGLDIYKDRFNLNGCVRGVIFKMRSGTELGRNLAYKAQEELENALLKIVDYAYQRTKCDNLCLAGGVALNCVANGRILKESKFKNIFIQPGGMDDGTSIGLAFFGWCNILKKKNRFVLKNAYLGVPYSKKDLMDCLDKKPLNLLKKYFIRQKDIARVAAREVANGKIVGWFQGASEFGPRALGHRSIIADPRRQEFKQILNEKKGRELFRPFAASVLLSDCIEYFDLNISSPFMLIAANVLSQQRPRIPAVVHVDGSTRVQTVTKEDNGVFYDLIKEFKALSGIPLVLNTSFNGRNEPLVETPKDALYSFLRMGLDCLVINDYFLERSRIPERLLEEIIISIKQKLIKMRSFKKNLKAAEKIYNYSKDGLEKLVDLKILKAEHFKEMGLYSKAIREYRGLIENNPDILKVRNGDIFLELGKIYVVLGEHKKAINELKRKEKITPQNMQTNNLLAYCYKATGDLSSFRKKIDQVTSGISENINK